MKYRWRVWGGSAVTNEHYGNRVVRIFYYERKIWRVRVCTTLPF